MARREHPLYENTEWEDYVFSEFPMMVYPGSADGGKTPDRDDRGKPVQKGVVCASEDEVFEALKEGAKLVPASAADPKGEGAQRLETPDDAKVALLAEAAKLGVEVDPKWSISRINSALEDAVAAGA